MADLNDISLFDVLLEPSEDKKPGEDKITAFEPASVDDFSPDIQFHTEEIEEVETLIPEKPYDARKEAEKMVNLIDAVNNIGLSSWGAIKVKKNYGGKEAFEKMKPAYKNKKAGKELSEEEEKLVDSFEAYKNDLKLLNGEIPYTDKQKRMLVEAAIPMMEDKKWEINGSMAFWMMFAGIEFSKIKTVLTI